MRHIIQKRRRQGLTAAIRLQKQIVDAGGKKGRVRRIGHQAKHAPDSKAKRRGSGAEGRGVRLPRSSSVTS
jgi:hypothetical protein